MPHVTAADALHPMRIPGYYEGPFAHRPELLEQRLFWFGHLYHCAGCGAAGRLLFGPDYAWAEHRKFNDSLWGRRDWPAFTIPLTEGHRLHIVYRTIPDEGGTDYLIHHPNWDQAEVIARVDGHFMGPGLSWAELTYAADRTPPGGTTSDPDARLLLLLPTLGDQRIPHDATGRLAKALRTRIDISPAEPLAAAILGSQGLLGPTTWTTTSSGARINTGEYSFRNPANSFALTDDGLARVTASLAPDIRQ